MKTRLSVSLWMTVLGFAVVGASASATIAPVGQCWQRDQSVSTGPFELPETVCVGDLEVSWRFDYPTHILSLNAKPYAGDFDLWEFEEYSDSSLVEATIFSKRVSDGKCFARKSAAVKFRFEVGFDSSWVKQPQLWAEYLETDESCRAVAGPALIAYKPIR